VVASLQSK